MFELLQFEFMQNALMAGLLTAVICGIIGTLVVVNRLVFLSGGIAHSAYGGIGLSYYMGWPWLPGAIGFALCSAMVMAAVSLRSRAHADTIIGVMWALGMASGILLLDLTPGYNVDLMSYLFGSILSVPVSELWLMSVVAVVLIIGTLWLFRDLVLMSCDEEFARTRGVPVTQLYFLLVGCVAVTVVLVVQVVGLILVIALLTIPPAIASRYSHSLSGMMVLACLLGAVFTSSGLWLSAVFDLTSGPAIIFLAAIFFFLQQGIDYLRQRMRRIV
ncbi:metal ABC transporter permease [Desulforhopalus vacuolatus]|uniref:metal ABC transporter permease n=1 Tax=Desulforhopalus vacuolatus TaxID=40414 RepID=UPI0019654A58|nr:metal ABC transporter permease [Desulforhopalus vacuolatus]MBM9519155.1 metal ABC transporter permease [Desulforhopalus vacuolatus]